MPLNKISKSEEYLWYWSRTADTREYVPSRRIDFSALMLLDGCQEKHPDCKN